MLGGDGEAIWRGNLDRERVRKKRERREKGIREAVVVSGEGVV